MPPRATKSGAGTPAFRPRTAAARAPAAATSTGARRCTATRSSPGCWTVGWSRSTARTGRWRGRRRRPLPDPTITVTGAPRVMGDIVVIGNAGAEYGVRGYVTAYDADTGEQRWRTHTVPGNPADGFESEAMRAAAETWTGEWWLVGGGGTVWDGMAADPEAGTATTAVPAAATTSTSPRFSPSTRRMAPSAGTTRPPPATTGTTPPPSRSCCWTW